MTLAGQAAFVTSKRTPSHPLTLTEADAMPSMVAASWMGVLICFAKSDTSHRTGQPTSSDTPRGGDQASALAHPAANFLHFLNLILTS